MNQVHLHIIRYKKKKMNEKRTGFASKFRQPYTRAQQMSKLDASRETAAHKNG
jgi:hypothetical protein